MEPKNKSISSLLVSEPHLNHEIRSLINTILNMTSLALRQNPSSQIKNYVKTIEKSANNLLEIFNDIIELSEIDKCNENKQHTKFAITDLLEELRESIQNNNLNNIDIKINLSQGILEWFIGPFETIKKVLIQIVTYAAKYLYSNQIELHINYQHLQNILEFKVIIINGLKASDNLHKTKLIICKRLLHNLGSKLSIEERNEKLAFIFSIPVQSLDQNFNKKLSPQPIVYLMGKDSFLMEIVKRKIETCGFKIRRLLDNNIKNIQNQGKKEIILLDWNSVIDIEDIWNVLISNHTLPPLIFFDVPPVKMIELGLQLDLTKGLSDRLGLVMFPTKGKQLINEMARILHLSIQDLSWENMEDDIMEKTNFKILKGQKILIVEDDKINQKIIIEMLKNFGVKPVVASTGKAAIMAAQKHQFSAILMDINLPDKSGYDVALEIRQVKGYKDIPIIALSATTKDNNMLKQARIDDFLSKPYSDLKLFNCLASHIIKDQ